MSIVQPGVRRNQELRYGNATTELFCWFEYEGKAYADGGTTSVSIYAPGSNTAIITGNANTNASTTSPAIIALDISNPSTYPLGENYRAVFQFTASNSMPATSAGVYHRTVLFDVVRTPIIHAIPLRVDDLKNAHAEIDAALEQLGQTSDAHARYIVPAWEDCLQYVEARGWRPALISSPDVLAPMLRYRALQRLCEGISRKPNDLWDAKAQRYEKDFQESRDATVLRYNEADTHTASQVPNWRQPRLSPGPNVRDPGARLMTRLRDDR